MRALLAIAFLAACGSHSTEPPEPGEISLEITSPSAGAELLSAEHPTIVVTGTATTSNPSYGAFEVYVNGQRVELDDAGAFTAEITPIAGINHVAVDVTDGVNMLVSRELDVMWAPDYLPPIAGTTGFDLASALELRLGQRFFDGRFFGTTLDLSP